MLPYNLHDVRIDLPLSLDYYLIWQFFDVSAFSVPCYYVYVNLPSPVLHASLTMAVLLELHSHLLVNGYGSDKKLVIYKLACI